MATLDLSALRDSLAALDRSLGYLNSDLAKDPGLREQFRAACIQGFEFTYTVTIKMIERQLEEISENPSEVDQLSFREKMRAGVEVGLVPDSDRFLEYRQQRGVTSHTYDHEKAEEILAVIPAFTTDVRFVLAELQRRNHGGD